MLEPYFELQVASEACLSSDFERPVASKACLSSDFERPVASKQCFRVFSGAKWLRCSK